MNVKKEYSKSYFETENGKIIHGDCRIVVNRYPENYFDTIITDPPYGLRFMNKKWDYDIPSVKTFKKLLRVAKPGATFLCFAGSRTQHRMGVNIEDAGWILKDTLMWFYGSGFPKATDISKQIDKSLGAEREVVGIITEGRAATPRRDIRGGRMHACSDGDVRGYMGNKITAPTTDEAKLWDGYKSHGLKPAYEPIIMAMKPNEGSYADNALEYGVSGINIDACRIKTGEQPEKTVAPGHASQNTRNIERGYRPNNYYKDQNGFEYTPNMAGRFPANIILTHHPECEYIGTKKAQSSPGGYERKAQSAFVEKEDGRHNTGYGLEEIESWNCHPDCSVGILDKQSGERKAGGKVIGTEPSRTGQNDIYGIYERIENNPFCDTGTASRFFYCAKASRSERGKDNKHPTVKPKKLIEYLVKLVTPPTGGLILDPYFGSGTLGVACEELDVGRGNSEPIKYIGIELEEESCQIAQSRIEKSRFQQQFKLF